MRLTAVGFICIFLCGTSIALAAVPAKVLFFPLDAPSISGNLSWLSEGIAMSISGQLNSPGIRVVDRKERFDLIENLDLPPDSHLSHGSMIRVAQEAHADWIIWGEISGTENGLKVVLRTLDVKNLKLSGAITANGPVSALPQMENELGWLILSNSGLRKGMTREVFNRRMRRIPNVEFASFIQSFNATGKSEQIRLLKKAVEGFNEFPEAHYQLGRLYFQKGDWDNAMTQLSLSDRDEGTDMEYDFIRGTCLVQQDHPVLAIQSLSQVLSSSRSFQVLNNIGVAYLRKGDAAQALNVLLEARNLARADTTVAMNLAITRYLQGNDAAARSILEDAAKEHPQNGMMQFLLGLVLRRLGETEQAERAMGRAKSMGLNLENLQAQDPKKWCLVHTAYEH